MLGTTHGRAKASDTSASAYGPCSVMQILTSSDEKSHPIPNPPRPPPPLLLLLLLSPPQPLLLPTSASLEAAAEKFGLELGPGRGRGALHRGRFFPLPQPASHTKLPHGKWLMKDATLGQALYRVPVVESQCQDDNIAQHSETYRHNPSQITRGVCLHYMIIPVWACVFFCARD
jgi:hypothetical protein